MPTAEQNATATVFYTAFQTLKRPDREAFFSLLFADKRVREDIADTLVLEARRSQSSRPLREFLRDCKIEL
jgi:hypothetical protein